MKAAGVPAIAACSMALLRRSLAAPVYAAGQNHEEAQYVTEARFYKKLANKTVQCELCPRQCVVAEGKRGHCRVRENRGGTYYTLVHSRVTAAHIDPIEKKPFFHVHPGALALSIATGGCNVNCKFCPNWVDFVEVNCVNCRAKTERACASTYRSSRELCPCETGNGG